MIQSVLDAGIGLLDTSDAYAAGANEELVGRGLAGRRDRAVVCTKFGWVLNESGKAVKLDSSPAHVRKACEGSLRRLKTDYIDLYQMHHVWRDAPWEEIWQAMELLVQQGKVLYVGSSNFAGWQIAQASETARARHFLGLAAEQSLYNLNARTVELEVLPACQAYGLGVIPWSPLAGGWLSGKWRKGGDDLTSNRANRIPQRYDLALPENQRKLDATDALGALADDAGIPLVHLAVAWVLRNPAVTSAIIGPRTMEQLTTQLGAADVELTDGVLDRIDEIVPPGTNFTWADAGYSPPMIADARKRRRRSR
jgi:aryl-alcohol dehydrogenase-like predicted oxidoreductase